MNDSAINLVLSRFPGARPTREGRWRATCPICGKHLEISVAEDGTVLIHDFHGCDKAAILAALGLRMADLFPPRGNGAWRRPPILRPMPKLPAEPITPVPDRERMEAFIDYWHRWFMEWPERDSVLARRRLSLDVVRQFRIGFVRKCYIREWTRPVTNAWVLPTPNGVKLHREGPGPRHPKCLWCPFGTVRDPGKPTPRHAEITLWPWPSPSVEWQERAAIGEYDGGLARADAEALADRDAPAYEPWLFLAPGELKCLAILAEGLPAVAITGGESHRWTPGLLAAFRGRRVCLVYDDDPTGRRFRDATVRALHGIAAEVKCWTLGVKP